MSAPKVIGSSADVSDPLHDRDLTPRESCMLPCIPTEGIFSLLPTVPALHAVSQASGWFSSLPDSISLSFSVPNPSLAQQIVTIYCAMSGEPIVALTRDT